MTLFGPHQEVVHFSSCIPSSGSLFRVVEHFPGHSLEHASFWKQACVAMKHVAYQEIFELTWERRAMIFPLKTIKQLFSEESLDPSKLPDRSAG